MTHYTATGPDGYSATIPAAMNAQDAARIASLDSGAPVSLIQVRLASPAYIIEICPHEPRASICTIGGESVGDDPDIADCRASGDCEPACEYVLDALGVEFRIVARDAAGKYENRLATDEELQATCEAIYFDHNGEFANDRRKCETYLVWEAASQAESE